MCAVLQFISENRGFTQSEKPDRMKRRGALDSVTAKSNAKWRANIQNARAADISGLRSLIMRALE